MFYLNASRYRMAMVFLNLGWVVFLIGFIGLRGFALPQPLKFALPMATAIGLGYLSLRTKCLKTGNMEADNKKFPGSNLENRN